VTATDAAMMTLSEALALSPAKPAIRKLRHDLDISCEWFIVRRDRTYGAVALPCRSFDDAIRKFAWFVEDVVVSRWS
jgi:hypothetical protein